MVVGPEHFKNLTEDKKNALVEYKKSIMKLKKDFFVIVRKL